jgi:hypothetical protein
MNFAKERNETEKQFRNWAKHIAIKSEKVLAVKQKCLNMI